MGGIRGIPTLSFNLVLFPQYHEFRPFFEQISKDDVYCKAFPSGFFYDLQGCQLSKGLTETNAVTINHTISWNSIQSDDQSISSSWLVFLNPSPFSRPIAQHEDRRSYTHLSKVRCSKAVLTSPSTGILSTEIKICISMDILDSTLINWIRNRSNMFSQICFGNTSPLTPPHEWFEC